MKEIKKAYTEILNLCEKYKDIDNETYDIKDMIGKSKRHLWACELEEKYGLKIDHSKIGVNSDYCRIDDYRFLGWYGEKYNRTISWEKDGKQPEDEFLLNLSFCTGPYIFGDDYPEDLFRDFFQELKNYNPKYCDTVNKCLYFSMENASKIFNDFPQILKKYHEINKKDCKERKIKKLQQELEKLNNAE